MNYLNHKYDKPWYRQSEILNLLGMSDSTLKRYMAEHRKAGKSLADMGYLKFEGFREACWQPGVLTHWLVQNKLEAETKYDYERAEQKRVQMNIINLNKNTKKKERLSNAN